MIICNYCIHDGVGGLVLVYLAPKIIFMMSNYCIHNPRESLDPQITPAAQGYWRLCCVKVQFECLV